MRTEQQQQTNSKIIIARVGAALSKPDTIKKTNKEVDINSTKIPDNTKKYAKSEEFNKSDKYEKTEETGNYFSKTEPRFPRTSLTRHEDFISDMDSKNPDKKMLQTIKKRKVLITKITGSKITESKGDELISLTKELSKIVKGLSEIEDKTKIKYNTYWKKLIYTVYFISKKIKDERTDSSSLRIAFQELTDCKNNLVRKKTISNKTSNNNDNVYNNDDVYNTETIKALLEQIQESIDKKEKEEEEEAIKNATAILEKSKKISDTRNKNMHNELYRILVEEKNEPLYEPEKIKFKYYENLTEKALDEKIKQYNNQTVQSQKENLLKDIKSLSRSLEENLPKQKLEENLPKQKKEEEPKAPDTTTPSTQGSKKTKIEQEEVTSEEDIKKK
jgi:hypothetical protein